MRPPGYPPRTAAYLPLPTGYSSHIMTKATETGIFLLALAALWALLYTAVIPLPDTVRTEVVPVLPWWLLVSFGSYALFTLGYDVVTFNDKPEKYRELMEQIAAAKTDLRAHGIVVSQ